MSGIRITPFPDPNLDRSSRAWTRNVEDRIGELEKSAARQVSGDRNLNASQNSTLDLVSRNIVDLETRLQDAINSISFAPGSMSAGVIASGVTIPAGQVTGAWTDTVDSPLVSGDTMYSSNAPLSSNNITTSRVVAWLQNSDGLIGNTASRRDLKHVLGAVDWSETKLAAIMDMSLIYFHWEAELEKRAEDPLYKVHQEIGFIAEEMHDHDLWEFVVYDREPNGELILDEDGEPRPMSIHYANWSLALHEVVRYLWSARQADRADLDRILTHLGL